MQGLRPYDICSTNTAKSFRTQIISSIFGICAIIHQQLVARTYEEYENQISAQKMDHTLAKFSGTVPVLDHFLIPTVFGCI